MEPDRVTTEIEVVVADTVLDLTRREADVVLRLGNPGQETRVGRLAFAVYAAPDLNARGLSDPAHGDWIGYGAAHGPLSRSLARWWPQMRQVYRTNSIIAAHATAQAEIGLAALPCMIADCDPALVRATALPEDFMLDLWVLTHEDLRHTARIRIFVDFMAAAPAADANLLEGRCPCKAIPAGA